jgi:hypothetical protein
MTQSSLYVKTAKKWQTSMFDSGVISGNFNVVEICNIGNTQTLLQK